MFQACFSAACGHLIALHAVLTKGFSWCQQGRDHLDFVCRLRDFLPARQIFIDGTVEALHAAGFAIREIALQEASAALDREYLRSTRVLEPG